MSGTEKLGISLPKDLIEKLLRAKDEGRIDSVSGYIADLLRREDDWRDARATLDRIFERCPDPEAKHYAWARPVPGGGDRWCPGPGGGDFEAAPTAAGRQAGGGVQDAVAQGLGLGPGQGAVERQQ